MLEPLLPNIHLLLQLPKMVTLSCHVLPAMRKLADEIFEWDNKKCFEHMVTYATTPPLLPKTFENSHGMRFWQADVLKTLGDKHKITNWTEASTLFRRSGEKNYGAVQSSVNPRQAPSI